VPPFEPRRWDIKALLSHNDWFADRAPDVVRKLGDAAKDPRQVRRELCDGRGLVILYPVSRHSIPLGVARKTDSRRPMEAPNHLMGLGLIFPEVERDGHSEDGTYYSVHPDWEVSATDEDEDLPVDREGSHTIDGEKVAIRS
jgi:hypothetical protein